MGGVPLAVNALLLRIRTVVKSRRPQALLSGAVYPEAPRR
jgi:hypothetical protein